MAVAARLKPIGPLAQTVDGLAKTKVISPNLGAAQKALQAAEPDFGAIVRNAKFEELVNRLFRTADQNILRQAGLQPLVDLHDQLLQAGLRLTKIDLSRCLEKMLRLQTSRGGLNFAALSAAKGTFTRLKRSRQAYINAFSGEFRERVVQHLPSVRMLADVLVKEAKKKAKATGGKRVTVIDTGSVGDVRMPTNPSSGSVPTLNALGPDRMFGFLVRDAKVQKGYAGTFHVTAIIEVKARSGALDGLDQTQKFIARASHGEVSIDGKLYRIVLDEKQIHQTVILPEDAIEKARTIAFAKKHGINVLTYPAKVEDMITKLSQETVDKMLILKQLLQ